MVTKRLSQWIEKAPSPVFVTFAILAAFSTYFCMYSYRKPFAAAKFEGITFLGTAVALKTALVISQIIGYAFSKYIGIKVCSEVTPGRRAWTLIGLVLAAEIALLDTDRNLLLAKSRAAHARALRHVDTRIADIMMESAHAR